MKARIVRSPFKKMTEMTSVLEHALEKVVAFSGPDSFLILDGTEADIAEINEMTGWEVVAESTLYSADDDTLVCHICGRVLVLQDGMYRCPNCPGVTTILD